MTVERERTVWLSPGGATVGMAVTSAFLPPRNGRPIGLRDRCDETRMRTGASGPYVRCAVAASIHEGPW